MLDKRGNRDLIAICCMNICLYALTYLFYRALNRRRDGIWVNWTTEVFFILRLCVLVQLTRFKERKEYLENTKDKGNERLDFRFAT